MIPWCKYSKKTDDRFCHICSKDKAPRWGLFPCYCLFYKPRFGQNVCFHIDLTLESIGNTIQKLLSTEE
jgi:hypothetical protein